MTDYLEEGPGQGEALLQALEAMAGRRRRMGAPPSLPRIFVYRAVSFPRRIGGSRTGRTPQGLPPGRRPRSSEGEGRMGRKPSRCSPSSWSGNGQRRP